MTQIGNIEASKLESFVQRIERLSEEKKNIAGDINEVYSEAKSMGFDKKIMHQVIKLREMDSADREEMELLLETYKRALNLINVDKSTMFEGD